MARYNINYRPSACTVTRADGTVTIEDARPRLHVSRDKPDEQADTQRSAAPLTPEPMFYLVTKRTADAMRGSRSAIKQLRKAVTYGVYATEDAAARDQDARGLRLVAAIVHI